MRGRCASYRWRWKLRPALGCQGCEPRCGVLRGAERPQRRLPPSMRRTLERGPPLARRVRPTNRKEGSFAHSAIRPVAWPVGTSTVAPLQLQASRPWRRCTAENTSEPPISIQRRGGMLSSSKVPVGGRAARTDGPQDASRVHLAKGRAAPPTPPAALHPPLCGTQPPYSCILILIIAADPLAALRSMAGWGPRSETRGPAQLALN